MVNTLRKNYKGFTSAEINRDDAVYKALGRLGYPTVDEFEKMICSNQIQNYPITSKDITNTKVRFGTHLSGLMGNTVIRTPKRVYSGCVEIPR